MGDLPAVAFVDLPDAVARVTGDSVGERHVTAVVTAALRLLVRHIRLERFVAHIGLPL